MVFHGVVEQGRADHVGVQDVVMADDPECDPQRVVDVRLVLPTVVAVEIRHQRECLLGLRPVLGAAQLSYFVFESEP